MCRLSVLYRVPLHEIALWPAAEVEVLKAYLDKRPATEDRLEAMIASGQAMWLSSKQKPGTDPPSVSDFLMYPDPWRDAPQANRYSDTDLSLLKALGAKVH